MPRRTWLTPLEQAWGIPLGRHTGTRALLAVADVSARAAFEHEVMIALRQPPCLVAFSGGRDSSAALAIAVAVARREDLPLPIPVTHVFPGVEDSEESEWQERVVRHLGLSEWTRMSWTDELDNIGPYAQRTLGALGVASPSNLHFLLPFMDAAAGGSLITGVGGDEIFALVGRTVAARVLYRRQGVRLREFPGLMANLAPRPIRARWISRDLELAYGWIRPDPLREIRRALVRWISQTPIRFDRAALEWWYPSRVLQVAGEYATAMAGLSEVTLVQPFSSGGFISALAGQVGRAGPGGRSRALAALCGDLLPTEVLTRTSKAGFDGAFNTSISRAFAHGWTGAGADGALVDTEALRAEWLSEHPDPHSLIMLQQAWLSHQFPASGSDGPEHPAGRP